MKITQEVRAFALEQAERRCECSGKSCRHHLADSRCKRGLRGDQWKVFWKAETGGITRENIAAWCLDCFDNNFEAPTEDVALLATDIMAYGRLVAEDQRRAVTLKSVLRDAATRSAEACRGRLVLDRLDDDILLEFPTSLDAVHAARGLRATFEELATRLDLPVPSVRGAIHRGPVTRWRNGLLAGDAVTITTTVRELAGEDQVVLTDPAAAPIQGDVELEPMVVTGEITPPSLRDIWVLSLAITP